MLPPVTPRNVQPTKSPVLLLALVMLTLSFLLVPAQKRIHCYKDDALFYGIIAANTVNGHPFSFDGGVSRTSGFHWLGMILPLSIAYLIRSLAGATNYAHLFNAVYFADMTILVALSFSAALLLGTKIRTFILTPFLLFLFSQTHAMGFGMEVVFLPFLLLTYIQIATTLRPRGPHQKWMIVLPALITAARIDYAPIAASIGFASYLLPGAHQNRMLRFRAPIHSLIGVAAGMLLVSILNLLAAGNLLSTSVLVKGNASKLTLSDLALNLQNKAWPLFLYLLLLAVILLNRTLRNPFNVTVAASGVWLLLQVSIQRSLGGNNLGSWYDVAWVSLLFVTGIIIVDNTITSTVRCRVPLAVLILAAILPITPRDLMRLRLVGRSQNVIEEYYANLRALGERVASLTNSEAILAVDDLPGRFTYFTRRNIVALDGLVNSPQYVRSYLLKGVIGDYIRSHVDYVIVLHRKELTRADPGVAMLRVNGHLAYVGFPFNKYLEMSPFRFKEEQVMFREQVLLTMDPDALSGIDQIWLVKVE